MTGKEFINSVANGKLDIIQVILDILTETGSRYCLIGGLAVNGYVEPVVSLDLDIVVAVENVEAFSRTARERGLKLSISSIASISAARRRTCVSSCRQIRDIGGLLQMRRRGMY